MDPSSSSSGVDDRRILQRNNIKKFHSRDGKKRPQRRAASTPSRTKIHLGNSQRPACPCAACYPHIHSRMVKIYEGKEEGKRAERQLRKF